MFELRWNIHTHTQTAHITYDLTVSAHRVCQTPLIGMKWT